jgi:lipopolysaccharide transport system permease protein
MTVVIEAGRSSKQYWLDLWRYRELFQILAWRDISVRYKQTVVGIAWAVIRPVLSMIVLTIIFGRIAKLPTDGSVPYALMVFAGMLPWLFFSSAISESSNSLVSNANLVSKVYFPRLIIPVATIAVALVDFLVCSIVMAFMMIWYQFVPSWQILLMPVAVIWACLAALGPSLWLTAVTVKYRDFRYAIPFLVQFGLYVSPVGFSSSVIPEQWRLIYSLNPVVGVIDLFRWCVLGESPIYVPSMVIGVMVTVVFLVLGIRQFKSMERQLADLI